MSEDLLKQIVPVASKYGLDPKLMYVVAIAESAGSPWAYRYENTYYGFLTRQDIPRGQKGPPSLLSERVGRATSWGIFQILGQTAREHGFNDQYLTALLDEKVNIELGCKIFAHKLEGAAGDIHKALTAWNGSPEYADRILTLYKGGRK